MQEFVLLTMILVLLLAAYWAMVVFPKQRDFQKRQKYVRSLSRGDEVITYGGIVGRIIDIDAEKAVAHIEIAENTIVRVILPALMQEYDPEEIVKSMNSSRTTIVSEQDP